MIEEEPVVFKTLAEYWTSQLTTFGYVVKRLCLRVNAVFET
jgi:hypothetical protein